MRTPLRSGRNISIYMKTKLQFLIVFGLPSANFSIKGNISILRQNQKSVLQRIILVYSYRLLIKNKTIFSLKNILIRWHNRYFTLSSMLSQNLEPNLITSLKSSFSLLFLRYLQEFKLAINATIIKNGHSIQELEIFWLKSRKKYKVHYKNPNSCHPIVITTL